MYTFNKLCTIMVTVVLVNNILSTQPKDITVSEYCHIFQNDCKGSDNVCKDFKCQGSHPYLCSSAYCSKNKNSCQRLINMDLVFNAYMKTRIDNFQFLKKTISCYLAWVLLHLSFLLFGAYFIISERTEFSDIGDYEIR